MHEIIGAGGVNANVAPDAFKRWAVHFYECKQQFRPPDPFSPVPDFLLCCAIELGIKATHLHHLTQRQITRKFGHDIMKAYNALPINNKTLCNAEVKMLQQASDIYDPKGFEYFEPDDALTGFRRYPDLAQLDVIAEKLIR
jgi:hypothetical protein